MHNGAENSGVGGVPGGMPGGTVGGMPAGHDHHHPLLDMPPLEWRRVIEVNLIGTMFAGDCAHALGV